MSYDACFGKRVLRAILMPHSFCFFLFFLALSAPAETSAANKIMGNWRSFAVDGYTDAGEKFCTEFRISKRAIRKYLRTIMSAPDRYYADDLYSPCKVNGVVHYPDGQTAKFVIQSSGIGSVTLPGKERMTVFSQPKWNDPNAGAYFNRD